MVLVRSSRPSDNVLWLAMSYAYRTNKKNAKVFFLNTYFCNIRALHEPIRALHEPKMSDDNRTTMQGSLLLAFAGEIEAHMPGTNHAATPNSGIGSGIGTRQ